MRWEDPSEYSGFDQRTPSPQDVTAFHTNSDKDASAFAIHHTLGLGPNQAAPGDHEHLIGKVIMYLGATVPNGYLGLNGQMFNGLLFPKLAAVVQEIYGPRSGDFYKLPNIAGRSPIGVGIASSGSTGNNYSLGLEWGHEATEAHSHTFTAGYSVTWNANNPWGEENIWFPTAEAAAGSASSNQLILHTGWGGTGITGAGDKGNVHPVLALNFITRAL